MGMVDVGWRRHADREVNRLKQSNFVILKTGNSHSPFDFDKSIELLAHCDRFFCALAMCGVGFGVQSLNSGVEIIGEYSGESPEIRSMSYIPTFYGPWKGSESSWEAISPIDISENVIFRAQAITSGLERIAMAEGDYERLNKAYYMWGIGMKTWDCQERLIQFVRTIECLFPEKDYGKNKFCENGRKSFFVSAEAGGEKKSILWRLYEIRNKLQHNASLCSVIEDFGPNDESKHRVMEHSLQAELLASNALRRVLSSPSIIRHYINNDAVESLFAELPNSKYACLGQDFDVLHEIDSRRSTQTEV